jgi:putative ABC transport system permease protein
MIVREVSRRPLRLLLSALGISLATGLVVVGRSMWDAIDHLLDVQFHNSMREDVTVSFIRPTDPRALSELGHLPGVFFAEGLRSVPVRFQAGHHTRDSVVMGYPAGLHLRRLLGANAEEHEVPENGILLTRKLGELLDVQIGDPVTVRLREGEWKVADVTVTGFVDEPFGLQGHMRDRQLNRLLGDSGTLNTVLLRVDPALSTDLERRLKAMPGVASVSSPKDFRRQFNDQSAAMMSLFTWILVLFASIIAVGVIYNNARVALSQRTRDLASLRVLGFTRREIAGILFGEQAIQVALAIPLGLWIGRKLARLMMSGADPEMYRLPIVVSEKTYVFAVAVTLGSAVVSAIILRSKLNRLDLIGVLKTRE